MKLSQRWEIEELFGFIFHKFSEAMNRSRLETIIVCEMFLHRKELKMTI